MSLSRSQRRVLTLVASYAHPDAKPGVYESGFRETPLFAPAPPSSKHAGGTRDMPWRVREQLVGLGLIEPFDYAAERAARGESGATPEFTYYRATPAGRAALAS